MRPYDVVTVTHLQELAAMRLQAQSLARFLEPRDVARIWVLLNDRCDAAGLAAFRSDITARFGGLGDKVSVLHVPDFCSAIDGFDGYVGQQVLKLRIAELVRSPFYVVLDTKNFAIGPVARDSFFDDGRPRATFELYAASYQADIVRCYYELFAVPPERRNFCLPAMMTPFGFETARVREVVRWIEAALGRSLELCFGEVLAGLGMFSEFCLFSVAIEAQGGATSAAYAQAEQLSITLWEGSVAGAGLLQAAILGGLQRGVHMAAIHRKRRMQMDRAEAAFLNGLLTSIGVLDRHTQPTAGF